MQLKREKKMSKDYIYGLSNEICLEDITAYIDQIVESVDFSADLDPFKCGYIAGLYSLRGLATQIAECVWNREKNEREKRED